MVKELVKNLLRGSSDKAGAAPEAVPDELPPLAEDVMQQSAASTASVTVEKPAEAAPSMEVPLYARDPREPDHSAFENSHSFHDAGDSGFFSNLASITSQQDC